ncbi:ABC transporter permease [Fructobacillus parabroussonetiae]|uniref:ABC transporter permease subunit n=1 Tax=Fructobacillus parabroussonetiae TaxID=2713174 RepID=A0ABS5QUL0_9LACO|nr:ABC transporter permease subunit [Fructobacillus parabroussonetiae]MBS9336874.1 ABC transporter permease subunit [Fructobacillus parabroussonetiae]
MHTLLKQEWMKAVKQNRFYVWALIAFILPIIVLTTLVPTDQQLVGYYSLGGAGIVVAIAASVISALTFTQEFNYGTIRPLLSRQYSRLEIFVSKIIMIVFEYILVLTSAVLGTLAGRLIFQMINGSTGTSIDWQPFLFNQVMDVIMTLFFFAIVLLVSNLVKSTAAAVSIGIVLSVATSIIAAITTFLVQFWEPLRWNPLTVEAFLSQFNGRQVQNEYMMNFFGTDVWVVWAVYIFYLVVLYLFTYLIFQRRSV